MIDTPELHAKKKSPWDWMGPEEIRLLGEIVAQPEEQARWCKAIVFGTLPYMWRDKATVVRELAYDKMELSSGNRVLLIGECLRVCGFVDDIRQQIGASGEIHEIDITNEARGAYLSGKRGRGGQLATWKWDYTRNLPSRHFDSVAVLQATQHTDDWRETGQELLRVLKAARPIVITEITLSPQLKMKAELDIHIEAWIDKIFSRIGWSFDQTPYHSLNDLRTAFDGLVNAPGAFDWRGIELFWARNKD
jgi:hypothetical protein